MTQQTTAWILATELENEAALEANEEIQDTLNKAAAELRRLDAIESEWARLSQDEGKAQREIERLRTAQQPAQQLKDWLNEDEKVKLTIAQEREACALVAESGFRFAKDGYAIADDIRTRIEA